MWWRSAAKCGVRYIVVESAGFAELGDEGKKMS